MWGVYKSINLIHKQPQANNIHISSSQVISNIQIISALTIIILI